MKILFHDSHVTNMSRDCSDRYKYMVYGFYSEFLLALSLSLVDLWIAFLSPIRSFSAFAFQIGSFSQADRLTRPNLRNVFIILFIAPIFSPISGRSLRAPRASSPSSCSISFRTKLINAFRIFKTYIINVFIVSNKCDGTFGIESTLKAASVVFISFLNFHSLKYFLFQFKLLLASSKRAANKVLTRRYLVSIFSFIHFVISLFALLSRVWGVFAPFHGY